MKLRRGFGEPDRFRLAPSARAPGFGWSGKTLIAAILAVVFLFVLLQEGFERLGSPPQRQLADRISASDRPVVQDVRWRPGTLFGQPSVDVDLVPTATESAVVALWCEVIVPAGGTSQPGDLKVNVWTAEDDPVQVPSSCG